MVFMVSAMFLLVLPILVVMVVLIGEWSYS